MGINHYFAVYLVFVLLSAVISFILKKYTFRGLNVEKVIFIVFVALLSCFEAFRPKVVPDTKNYIHYFNIIKLFKVGKFSLIVDDGNFEMEYGFLLLTKLINIFTSNIYIYFFIISFLVNLTTVYGMLMIKEYLELEEQKSRSYSSTILLKNNFNSSFKGDYFLFLTLFLAYNGFHNGCIAIRAGLSIGFGLMGLGIFLKENNYISSVLFLIMSIAMHTMGIVYLAIFILIILDIKISNKFNIPIIIGLIGFYLVNFGRKLFVFLNFLLIKIFSVIGTDVFDNYLKNSTGEKYRSSIVLLLKIITFSALLIAVIFNNKYGKYNNIYFIALLGQIVQCTCYPLLGLYRILDYFYVFLLILIGYNVIKTRGEIRIKNVIIFCCMPVVLAFQYSTCCMR